MLDISAAVQTAFDISEDNPDCTEVAAQLGLTAVGSHADEVVLLDSFDWDLYREGLLGRFVRDGERSYFEIESLDTGRRVFAAACDGPPGLAASEEPGRLRDELERRLGLRRLLPIAHLSRAITSWANVDPQGKTVARLDLIRSEAREGRSISRLLVRAGRGYLQQGRRLAEQVGKALGSAPSEVDTLRAQLSLVGREPFDNRVELAVLDDSMSLATAIATRLAPLARTMELCEEGIRRDWDTEFLHDYRVAVRRTRTLIGRFRDALPEIADFADDFRWLGQLTSPLRDWDVYLLTVPGYPMPRDAEPARAALIRAAQKRREAAFRALEKGLRSQRFRRLMRDWMRCLHRLAQPGGATTREAGARARDVAGSTIYSAYRKLIRFGSLIGDESPDEDLHSERKRAKQLRYLLEAFRDLYPADEMATLISDLKRFQNVLGEFQDLSTQIDTLTLLAADVGAGRIEDQLAIGELRGYLRARQRKVRRRFASAFERISSSKERKRFRTLFAPRKVRKKG